MPEPSEDLAVEMDSEEAATSLSNEVRLLEGVTAEKVKSERLDGQAAEWIVVATTALTVLPKVLDSIAKLVAVMKVRSITVGRSTIKNPTAADIRALRDKPRPNTKGH
jgi:hypothetical protein